MLLRYISTEGGSSTYPGCGHLSHFPNTYFNFYIRPVVCTHILCRYFNFCNTIDQHNTMWEFSLVLDKYWVAQSGNFRLTTTVALGMGIIYGKLLYCHGVAEGNMDRNI